MSTPSNQHDIWSLPIGTVVRVSHGWYDHVGLIGDNIFRGERTVVSFSAKAGGFLEEPFSAFASGRQVTIDGYPGGLPPQNVMQRARLKRRQSYSWTQFNCEHFVRYAHGVPSESPQLARWAFLGGVLGFAAFALART